LVTDGRYADQVRKEVTMARILISKGGLFERIAQRGILKKAKRIGVQSQHLSLAAFANLKRHLPGKRWHHGRQLVEEEIMVKDRGEIEQIRKAVEITDKVFTKLLSIIKPGMRERDIAAEISYWHRRFGADADAFEPIVASGARGAFPHARASLKKIKKGELVTIDLGCRVNGYHSDMTRTVAVGRPRPRAERIYEAVRDAQAKAVETIRSGLQAKDVDAVARESLRCFGLAKHFTHSLGHGIGLQVHEPPRLSALSNETLRAGMVVTVEPGVYISGFGGVRIEDDVLIRNGFGEPLNRSSKELIVV
jgi:Xaa-Pro aminopeptidase